MKAEAPMRQGGPSAGGRGRGIPYVQNIIADLLEFWSAKGCAVLQPLDLQVGAGTFHPATTLRALGPRHWSAAYVQPSRRPTDGRYGRHPNRLQRYYQLQVVQKPNPPSFQQDYLESLAMLGISEREHDIRFIEDDWKSPTLGAWGLGWEVWCDGMEITQFTYFQEVGGIKCQPVMGEITYGVERLAMYLQDIDNVYDLQWCEGLSYGDLYQDNERQQSEYNYAGDDTEELSARFEMAKGRCRRLMDAEDKGQERQALVAYEAALECSHLFNLLDARRYFSVDARNSKINEIRSMCCKVAAGYLAAQTGADQSQ